jgi:alpha-beta hydrolase superfamily lysophospholipase
VVHSEGSFESPICDTIYYQAWHPATPPRGVLLLVHGLAEYSGRYDGFAEFFTAAGLAVYALDLPGHGRSAGERGHVKHFSDFTDAVGGFVAVVKEAEPGQPVVLVGHSLGGLIASAFLIEHQDEFAAAVLSGPAIQAPEQPSGCAMLIMRTLSKLLPRLGVMQLEAEGVSKDPEVVQAYLNDPLVFTGKVTARLSAEAFGAMTSVFANAALIRLPMLILHGGEDVLTSVPGSQALYERIESADKKIEIYDGLYHEIFNEPERIDVMTDMRDWLDSRL